MWGSAEANDWLLVGSPVRGILANLRLVRRAETGGAQGTRLRPKPHFVELDRTCLLYTSIFIVRLRIHFFSCTFVVAYYVCVVKP